MPCTAIRMDSRLVVVLYREKLQQHMLNHGYTKHVCVCACVSVCACVHACVRACMHACVSVSAGVCVRIVN